MIAAAKKGRRRYGLRDAAMILVAFRHGLRVSELCTLTWDQIDFSHGLIHVRRLKNGIPSVHQLGGEEMRSLRALKREDGAGRYIFMTERGAPMTPAGFRKLLSRLAIAAKFQFSVHPHMLQARVRFQARQRWPGHARPPALPRPQEHHAHRALHGAVTRPLQELLGGLSKMVVHPRLDGAIVANVGSPPDSGRNRCTAEVVGFVPNVWSGRASQGGLLSGRT